MTNLVQSPFVIIKEEEENIPSPLPFETLETMEDEQKDVDNKSDLVTALTEIQAMLKVELEHWFRTDNSATSDRIAQYDAAIELLIAFVKEKDVKAFCLVFQKYKITIQGIRTCFYASGPRVKSKRNRAHRLFSRVCTIMVGKTFCVLPPFFLSFFHLIL